MPEFVLEFTAGVLLVAVVLLVLQWGRMRRLRHALAAAEADRSHEAHLAAELLRSSTDLICVTRLHAEETRFNSCWESLLGYAPRN